MISFGILICCPTTDILRTQRVIMSTSPIYLIWTFCPHSASQNKWIWLSSYSWNPEILLLCTEQSHSSTQHVAKKTCFDVFGFQVILWVSPINRSAIVPHDTVGSQSIAHCRSWVGHRAEPAEMAWTIWRHMQLKKLFLHRWSPSFRQRTTVCMLSEHPSASSLWHPGMSGFTFLHVHAL